MTSPDEDTTMHIAPSKPLIRARSVVQVHPGPPFQITSKYAAILTFPFSGSPLKNVLSPFVNFTIAGWQYTQGR